MKTMNKSQDLTNPNSLRSKIRKRRVKHLVNFIFEIIKKEGLTKLKICDIGGTYRYWLLFPFEDFKEITFEISIVNLEKIIELENTNYSKLFNHANLKFKTEVGNGCDMPQYEVNEYHLAFSTSVIEHVGNWQNIIKFASETQRVGKYHFIQTPNYCFPIEPHYFLPLIHFFPRPIHTKLLMLLKKRSFHEATANFEDNRMLTLKEFRYVYPHSKLIKEKYFLLNKSFTLISKIKN